MAFLNRLCNPRGDEIDAGSSQIPSTPSLKSTLKPVPEDGTFHLFSFLPKELRLQIWEEATPRERVVHVGLGIYRNDDETFVDAPVRYLEKNHLGNPVSGSLYWILVQDLRLEHPLLTVNREAKQVVLNFYRIQMPAHSTSARYRIPPGYGGLKTLYINPEHDVLQISAQEPVSRTLIDFLWDLKAYDPKGVGLLKLATSLLGFCSNDLQYLKRSDLMLIRQRHALVNTLSQLQEVWFMNDEPVKNGYVLGKGSRGGTIPFGLRMVEFDNVGPETREGAEYALTRLFVGTIDPRELIWRWKRLLRTWKISHPPGQVKYRVIMARRQFPVDDDAKSVGRLSRVIDSLTLRHPDPYKEMLCCACEPGGSSLPEKVTPKGPDASKTAAVGFWSFPIEAVGEVGEGENLSDMDFKIGRHLDMRSYWPELLVAKMA